MRRCTCGCRSWARSRSPRRRPSIIRGAIAFHVTGRGLSTRTLPHGTRSFAIEFDFIDHQVVDPRLRWHDASAAAGAAHGRRLLPRHDGDTARDVAAREDLDRAVGGSVADPVRGGHRPRARTTPRHANRFWRILVQVERVLTDTRCTFIGKCQSRSFLLGRDGYGGDTFLRPSGAAARRAGVHARGVLTGSDQPRLLARQRAAARAHLLRATPYRSRPVSKKRASSRPPRTITRKWASSSCRTKRSAAPPIPTPRFAAS